MELSTIVLVNRNGVLYKAPIEALSSIVLLISAKETFSSYLDSLSISIELLTSSFESKLYTKADMKADFATKDQVDSLTANGTYVLSGDAAATASSLKSKTDLSSTTGKSWYEIQSMRSVRDVIEGYSKSNGIFAAEASEEHSAEEYLITPDYKNLMDSFPDDDL